MAQLNFDASQVAPQTSQEAVPTNWYKVAIEKSEIKESSKKTSHYLGLDLKIIEGEHAGKSLFHNLNLWHPNAVTVEIAQKQLSSICHATQVIHCEDSQQLHNLPFMARVIYVAPEGNYDAKNDVKAFKAATGAAVAAPGMAAPGMAPVASPIAPAVIPPAAIPAAAPALAPAAIPAAVAPVAAVPGGVPPAYIPPAAAVPGAVAPAAVAPMAVAPVAAPAAVAPAAVAPVVGTPPAAAGVPSWAQPAQ